MTTTRRSLLRNGSLLTLASTVPALLQGCKPKTAQPPQLARQAKRKNGLQIIFSGAWFFCSDGKSGMYALTRPMLDPGNKVKHYFPFGPWQGGGFNQIMPCLKPNPKIQASSEADQHAIPYKLTIDSWTSPTSLSDVFAAAARDYSFNYFRNAPENQKDHISLDTTVPGLISIALPIPTSIQPASFLTHAAVSGTLSSSNRSSSLSNIATAHIFSYVGAEALRFDTGTTEAHIEKGSDLNFHFHTVSDAGHAHAPDMFLSILSAFTRNDGSRKRPMDETDAKLTLIDECPVRGAQTPTDLSDQELEDECTSPTSNPSKGLGLVSPNVGSCSGGGFGIDGDPCSC